MNTLSGDEPLVFDRCVLQNCKIQLKGVGGSLFIFRSVERVKIIFSSAALVNSEILDASILFGKGILLTNTKLKNCLYERHISSDSQGEFSVEDFCSFDQTEKRGLKFRLIRD